MKKIHLEGGVLALLPLLPLLPVLSACDDAPEEVVPEAIFLSASATTEETDEACAETEALLLGVRDSVEAAERADEAAEDIQYAIFRIRALAVRSGTEAVSSTDRSRLQARFETWSDQIDRVANTARFGDTYLADGSSTGLVTDVGEDTPIEVPLALLVATALGVDPGSIQVETSHGARSALSDLAAAELAVVEHREALDDALYSLYAYTERLHGELRSCDIAAARQIVTRCDGSRDPDAVRATGDAIVLRALAHDIDDAQRLVDRADGLTEHTAELIARMATNAEAAAAETDDEARRRNQAEYLALDEEITRGANTGEFGRIQIGDGTNSVLSMQLTDSAEGVVDAYLGDLRATALGIDSGSIYMEDADAAGDARPIIQDATNQVDAMRADYAAARDVLGLYADRVRSDQQDCGD